MRYLLFLLAVLLWLLPSCKNPLDNYQPITYPDTVVVIDQLTPQICEVRIRNSDSTQHTTDYWADKQTGRLVYKMKDTPYRNSRIHGTQYKYDEDGDTLLIAHFENGIRVDSTVYYWPNGNPKHKFFYSEKNNGNITFEARYHENGAKETDVVMYENGVISGAIDYYDSEPPYKVTETYYYREGELIGIKIYNASYKELERRRDYLLAEYRKDSARIADILFAQDGDGDAIDVPVYYIGTEADALHDVGEPDNWDIMKIDPAFMLRYHKR